MRTRFFIGHVRRFVRPGRWQATLLLCLITGVTGARFLDAWVARTVLPPLVPAVSVTVEDRSGALLRAYTVADGRWRLPAQISDVDPRFVEMLIAYEDRRFYRHAGVDFRALARAAVQALWYGRVVSGGSTLTMQVARLLEDSGTGRWRAKLRQARLALALERKLDKAGILGLYLQLAPYGGNLEGLRAACLAYFGKEPVRLTAAQAALLIALPQSPNRRRPDRHAAAAREARDHVLRRLVLAGALPADEAYAARREAMPEARIAFPALAPHLSDRALAASNGARKLRLTVDKTLQRKLEILAASRVSQMADGLSAAILVVDHETGEIRASVGSAGFLDQDRAGFVDMTRAIRSPGSTLKPFVYGLAFEMGIAHPDTLIDDRPMSFAGYAPLNFDRQFLGTLTMRDALRYSRNIPAVAILDAIGPARLTQRFRRAGVSVRLPGDAPPGLAIALGGVGVSLEDLVTLYAGLARGGVAIRPGYLPAGKRLPPQKPLLSPLAAWQVADILTNVQSPSLAPDNDLAYKTGTSYGYRDAWAVGFDGRHVIGVWIGRPDGASVPGILGADTAAPLLFESFSRLKADLAPLPPPPPSALLLSNAGLPEPLRRFHGANGSRPQQENLPEIAFPPDGARVALDPDMPLIASVRNGWPPFTWIADGVPVVVASRERQVEIIARSRGYVDLSVVDARGRSERVVVELQ